MVPPSRRPDRQRLYLRVRAISPQHSLGRTRPRFSSSRLGPHFEDGLIRRGPNGPDLWVVAGGQGRGRCSLCLETSNGKPTSFESGNIAWLTVHSGHNLTQCAGRSWRALRESNPCFRRERAASWTARRRARGRALIRAGAFGDKRSAPLDRHPIGAAAQSAPSPPPGRSPSRR